MNKEKVVVTGGAGFIGSNLAAQLLSEGFEVHIVDTLIGGKKERVPNEAHLHKVDIRSKEELLPIFDGAQYVFHLAALPRVQYSIEFPEETSSVNVLGTLSVLEAARAMSVKKVVYSASSSAYGDQEKLPLTEDMEARPKSPYGLQKRIGEEYCAVWSEVYGLPTVSLRYFNVYGPGQSDDGAYALVIAKFLKSRREGKQLTITGNGEQTRDFTHVRDVVSANILAARSEKVGKGEIINIGAGANQSIKYIAELIGGEVEYIDARLEPKNTLADNSRAQDLLGWVPTISIEEGILDLKTREGKGV